MVSLDIVLEEDLIERESDGKIVFEEGILYDLGENKVYNKENVYYLTDKERDLLIYLCKFKGKSVTYDDILENVWGYENIQGVKTKTLGTHISSLRKKIKQNSGNQEFIHTEKNRAFRIDDSVDFIGDFKVEEVEDNIIAFEDNILWYDVNRNELHKRDNIDKLKLKGRNLLIYMCKFKGNAISRDEILKNVWGYEDIEGVDTRTIDMYISYLRDLLEECAREPKYIFTEFNAGYRMSPMIKIIGDLGNV